VSAWASELPKAHQHQELYASVVVVVVVSDVVVVLVVVGGGGVVVVVDVVGSGSGDGHNFSQTNVLNLILWQDNGALFHPICS
jgi:ATP-dependent protease HslVU (ClpYQ) peptidase subunit